MEEGRALALAGRISRGGKKLEAPKLGSQSSFTRVKLNRSLETVNFKYGFAENWTSNAISRNVLSWKQARKNRAWKGKRGIGPKLVDAYVAAYPIQFPPDRGGCTSPGS